MATQEWHAIALDVTEHYRLAEEDRPYITAIWDVFFYDATTATHLCEITPSYHLRYLYTTALTVDDCPDSVRDRIDSAYCYEPTEDTYMHVSSVKRYISAHPDRHHAASAKLNAHDDPEEDAEEAIREYWQGNCPF